jgi:hypothetical protein
MSKIRVIFNRSTLQNARAWFDSELMKVDPNEPLPKAMEKLIRWFIHNGKSQISGEVTKDIDRDLAMHFVDGFIQKFKAEDPALLLMTEATPAIGLPSVASLVLSVRGALDRKSSRPHTGIDPLEVDAENRRLKSQRKRLGYQQRERLLLQKFPATRNTVFKALKEGQDAASMIEEASANVPHNHEVAMALVDYESKTVELIAIPKTR